jgi:ubiquinone/menaquinone biosynthesis C-methylase UbiE
MYNAQTIADFFDNYGEKEWERLVATPRDQVSFYIHTHYLQKFIRAGDSVLEAGAGAGRFTIELAKLGANITVGDISKVQLELNEKYVKQAAFEERVEARVQLDITSLAEFEDNQFDAVVCYGGPLSYVLDKAEQAVNEMLRVTKPGGHIFLSVMSYLGITRSLFELITTLKNYPEVVNRVNANGLLTPDDGAHHAHKAYRYRELKKLLQASPCKIVAASAANYLSLGRDEFLQTHLQTEELKQMFLAWELDFCAEEGAVDGGTHMIVVVQKDSQ